MQNENTPAEGKNSAKLEAESALRGAACSGFRCQQEEIDALSKRIDQLKKEQQHCDHKWSMPYGGDPAVVDPFSGRETKPATTAHLHKCIKCGLVDSYAPERPCGCTRQTIL